MGIWLRDTWSAAGSRSTGCLLLHGFSGEPRELLPLAETLAGHGWPVRLPVLPGHGGAPHDLMETRWPDWLDAARSEAAILRRTVDRLIVIGFSMGALLASLLAASTPDIAAVALLAPALLLTGDELLPLAARATWAVPWFYPFRRANFSDPAVRTSLAHYDPTIDPDDPATQGVLRRHVRLPVRALGDMLTLGRMVREELQHVTQPVLLAHGLRDEVARPASTTWLAHHLPTPPTVRWYAASPHLLVTGPEQQRVCAEVAAWCDQASAAAPLAPTSA